MSYSQTTLASLSAEIAATLGDPNYSYWSSQEITYAIQEAMREWGARTAYWRERGAWTIAPPKSINPAKYFYDLSVVLPTLRARTVTIDDILTEIQYHFLEAASGYSGAGMTDQFSITELRQAVVRARNRFVLDAQIPVSLTGSLAVVTDPSGRFPLPEDTVYLHRLMWIDANGAYYPLYRSDGFAMDALNPYWPQTPNRPSSFSQAETMPIQVQLDPVPISSGTCEMLSVQSLASIGSGDSLQVPDDWAHAIKYAAMADVLSLDSDSSNPFLSAYCDFRYNAIVEAARVQKTIARVQVNNKPVGLSPLYSLDTLRPNWHTTPGTPDTAVCAYDLIAFSPVANGTYGVTADVVRSAPVPVNPTDTIQMGLEEIENIIDYCQHYLSLKMNGEEFKSTFSLYDGYQKQAVKRNGILANQARYLVDLFGQSAWDQAKNPDSVEFDAQPALLGQ